MAAVDKTNASRAALRLVAVDLTRFIPHPIPIDEINEISAVRQVKFTRYIDPVTNKVPNNFA